MGDENGLIGLAEVIGSLRRELTEASRQAENEKLKFTLEDIEVEFQVTAGKTKEGGGGAGIKFWVAEANASGKRTVTLEEMQKVRLKLKPRRTDGSSTELKSNPVDKPDDWS
ncbi:MAG: hypothetical protein HQL82_07910 [Magnetococcales bacterium]|nr:hypothetical protein [Magnetococcales bacterium]